MKRIMLGGLALVVLAAAGAVAGEGLKSGPQVGKTIPGPFDEAVLLVVAAILWLGYRDRLRAAWRDAG